MGTNLAALPPHKITELGIAHVPEGRQVFPEMTVHENLEIGSYAPARQGRSRHARSISSTAFFRASPNAASSSPAR